MLSLHVFSQISGRQILMIESARIEKENTYFQYGQGLVIQFKGLKKTYLLTPAHVVDGGHQFSFFCDKKTKVPLALLGHSPTYDLSLLEVEKLPRDCTLNPLLTIDPASLNTQIAPFLTQSSGFRYASPEKEEFVAGIIGQEPLRNDKIDLTPYSSDLLLSEMSIRPGMSGAAVIMANRPNTILGMAIKTEINGRKSLAIPTKEIVPIAIELLKVGDPWRKHHQTEAYLQR